MRRDLAIRELMARVRGRSDDPKPLHICARTNNQEPFTIEMSEVWSICENYLYFIKFIFNAKIHCFVLMNNHFHLLATFEDMNSGSAMGYFMRETSRSIQQLAGTKNHLWGQRYFSSVIKTDHYFYNAYKYVYQNPLRAGLCERPEEYPFSTLHGLVGKSRLSVPVEEDPLLFDQIDHTLDWLSVVPSEDDLTAIRSGLRRKTFEIPLNRKTRQPHRLEKERL